MLVVYEQSDRKIKCFGCQKAPRFLATYVEKPTKAWERCGVTFCCDCLLKGVREIRWEARAAAIDDAIRASEEDPER